MGLGNNCIRMFESMAMATACLTDDCPLKNFWLVPPEDGYHCFFMRYDLDGFEERCREVLSDDTKVLEVARNGYEFWKRYHTFKAIGIYGNTLLEYMKTGDFGFQGCGIGKEEFYTEVVSRM